MIREFCAWITRTPFSQFVQNVPWVIPTVQIIHILCIATVISTAAILAQRLLVDRASSLSAVVARALPWIWTALVLLAISGAILISGEPSRDLPNPMFQIKMALVASAVGATLVLKRLVSRRVKGSSERGSRSPAAKTVGLVCLLLWVAVIFAGRWIAYVDSAQ